MIDMPSLKAAGKKIIEQRYGGSPVPSVPSLKTAGKKYVKSKITGKKSRVLSPEEQRKGMQGLAKKYSAPVKPATPGKVVLENPRMTVTSRGGGWARVTYRDPRASTPVTFSMRMSEVKKSFAKKATAWYEPETDVYRKWIRSTKAGELHSKRRQVEGALKIAERKGDEEMADAWRKVLQMSDEKVAQFWDEWTDSMSDVELDEYFEYDEDDFKVVGDDWL